MIRISRRARFAPRQMCGALAEGHVVVRASRSRSSAYGSANTASSRLPEANHMTTLSPSLIFWPCSSTSRVAVRRKW